MTKLTVFVNTLPVNPRSGGMKTFLLELLLALAEINNQKINYCLICTPLNKGLFDFLKDKENFNVVVVDNNNIKPVNRIFYEQFRLYKMLNKQENALLLNICNVGIMKCKLPQVNILQVQLGIAELRKQLPSKYISISALHKIYYDLLLKPSIKQSAKTIAICNFMLEFLQPFKDKVEVIHEGVNLQKFSANGAPASQSVQPYILCVSTLFPHKNMDRLIEAFALFRKKYNLNYKLIIAGKDPDNRQLDILRKVAKNNQVENEVELLGWVSLDTITKLYAEASLFVFISSMEFFGLPVLEAMAAEVPVIAANKMSLTEIVNDAGILIDDPDNINEVSEKIKDVLTSPDLQKELIKKGKENIKQFQWSLTAKNFERVFNEVSSA
ncbi:MAG TPA: glycosyltransferase family 1 protein [Parafilimonas sp.]|nr:glycosyltransferase family 1 protein [Parafilimonas sp.]